MYRVSLFLRFSLIAAVTLLGSSQAGAQAADLLELKQRVQSLRAQIKSLSEELSSAETSLSEATAELENIARKSQSAAPVVVASGSYTPEQRAFFEQRALPVLAENCVKCHGEKKSKADFRMDTLEGLLEGGFEGPSIVPGKPEESFLLEVLSQKHEITMPPEDEDPLTADQVDTLTEWIRIGAPWPSDIFMPTVAKDSSSDGPADPPRDALNLVLAKVGAAPVDFNRDIRPILSDKCYTCHGPDPNARKASLRLDDGIRAFEELRSGNKALVPGDLVASALIQKIVHADPEERMPPAKAIKQLTQEEADLIAQWVQDGAQWDTHWAWSAPKRTEQPNVENPFWVKNSIDSYVLARLEKEGLEPSPAADRETLIRRVTLDLTGLPPTIEEVDAFLADRQPQAYGRVVDRLLDTPQYGEHMARYWLDLARYADTNGYHHDSNREIWRWRDWVIDAFNQNMPFDKFTIDQIAGDLVPNPTVEQQIATGFNRNHMINNEVGAYVEEYRTQYVFDRVDTTGTVWLGLSVSCAKCHTHKYDPISQTEYYQMFSFFNNMSETPPFRTFRIFEGSQGPQMRAPFPAQRPRFAELQSPVEEARLSRNAPIPTLDAAQAAWESGWLEAAGDRWRPLTGELIEKESKHRQGEGELRLESNAPLDSVTALRMDIVPTTDHGPMLNIKETFFEIVSPPVGDDPDETITPVKIAGVNSDRLRAGLLKKYYGGGTNDAGQIADGDMGSKWEIMDSDFGKTRSVIFIPEAPIDVPEGSRLRITMHHNARPSENRVVDYHFSTTTTHAEAFSRAKMGPWHSSGAFDAESGDEAYKAVYAPENEIDLEAAYEDGRNKWTLLSGHEDGKVHPLNNGVGATYMYREIESPTRRVASFRVSDTEARKVWLNGVVVHEDKTDPAEKAKNAPEQTIAAGKKTNQVGFFVTLDKGVNRLLIKVVNHSDESSFYFSTNYEEYGPEPLDIAVMLATEDHAERNATRLQDYYRDLHSPEWRALDVTFSRVKKDLNGYESSLPMTLVMRDMDTPRDTHVLIRGEYDQLGEKVEAGVPDAFPPLPEGAPNNRLGFAQWLVAPNHPLTARVAVNRYWQQYFGTGIVKTSADFGLQGEWPSHPELLDWLSTKFIDSGWDVKGIQRLIVTSATYRQMSHVTPELLEHDPENRLFTRGPLFRLDAEAVRDTALSISGLLSNNTIGGRSVKPWQPDGLWEAVAIGKSLTRKGLYTQAKGENNYRRSMYTYWKRTLPPPNMSLFDAPEREFCVSQRERTNTPLQALVLLNDPQFVEASRAFAERLMKEGGPDLRSKVAYAFKLSTARRATEQEIDIVVNVYRAELEEYKSNSAAVDEFLSVGIFKHDPSLDRSELAAWSTVASMLLNLDETISKS
jgi:mono/diheme cytochrome c family protein